MHIADTLCGASPRHRFESRYLEIDVEVRLQPRRVARWVSGCCSGACRVVSLERHVMDVTLLPWRVTRWVPRRCGEAAREPRQCMQMWVLAALQSAEGSYGLWNLVGFHRKSMIQAFVPLVRWPLQKRCLARAYRSNGSILVQSLAETGGGGQSIAETKSVIAACICALTWPIGLCTVCCDRPLYQRIIDVTLLLFTRQPRLLCFCRRLWPKGGHTTTLY